MESRTPAPKWSSSANWLDFVGATPAALYARLATAALVVVRGTAFRYEPAGDNAGTVHMSSDSPQPEANWVLWEGVLRFAFDLTRKQGEVSAARLTDDGRSCQIEVKWGR